MPKVTELISAGTRIQTRRMTPDPKFCCISGLPGKAQCPRCTLTGRMNVRGRQSRTPRCSNIGFHHVLENCVVVVPQPHRATYTQLSAKPGSKVGSKLVREDSCGLDLGLPHGTACPGFLGAVLVFIFCPDIIINNTFLHSRKCPSLGDKSLSLNLLPTETYPPYSPHGSLFETNVCFQAPSPN